MFDQQIIFDGRAPAEGADDEINAVDMAVLLAFEELQEEDEPDLVLELIDLYLQDALVRIEMIQQAAAQADLPSLRSAAHSLKGSSGTLGVHHLASVCEELEFLPDDASTADANITVLRLEKEFVCVREALVSIQHLRRLPCPASVLSPTPRPPRGQPASGGSI